MSLALTISQLGNERHSKQNFYLTYIKYNLLFLCSGYFYDTTQSFVATMVLTKCGENIYDGLAGLWQTGLFSDVEVCVGCLKLQSHKVILSAHSPMFQAMFTNEMKEASCGRVVLASYTPGNFRAVLEFMYKGIMICGSPFFLIGYLLQYSCSVIYHIHVCLVTLMFLSIAYIMLIFTNIVLFTKWQVWWGYWPEYSQYSFTCGLGIMWCVVVPPINILPKL